MGRHCYFAEESPAIEIRGKVIFIQPIGTHSEIAISPETLAKFVAKSNRVLDEIFERRPAKVLPIGKG